MIQTPSESGQYREYIRFIMRMFELARRGQLESDDANLRREEIEGVWDTLSRDEKKRLRGLSMDLKYLLKSGRSGVGPLTGKEPAEIHELVKNETDPDRRLERLREFQDKMPASMVSFIRGRIWNEWEIPDVAAEFFLDARRFNDEDPFLQGTYLQALRYADLPEAKKMANAIQAEDQSDSHR